MLKFIKTSPYIPDPQPAKTAISAEDALRARQSPPEVVPMHCKPWLDAQKLDWTLFYGYISPIQISADQAGRLQVDGLDELARETGQARVVDQFAQGHFGLGCGYTLITPPKFDSLILPANQSPANLRALTAVIESDWYPQQLFLVFEVPNPGEKIQLDHGDPLARVVVMPRQSLSQAQPASPDEIERIKVQREAYQQTEQSGELSWTAASGDTFTHVYKELSKKHHSADSDGEENGENV